MLPASGGASRRWRISHPEAAKSWFGAPTATLTRWPSAAEHEAAQPARAVRRGHAMIPSRDIWRAAQLMVKRYGADAGAQAAQRADELATEGDHDGAATWRAIVRAIEELQRAERRPGEPVN